VDLLYKTVIKESLEVCEVLRVEEKSFGDLNWHRMRLSLSRQIVVRDTREAQFNVALVPDRQREPPGQ
jgi:hypothetical protein